jgi:micrococcal nuclease
MLPLDKLYYYKAFITEVIDGDTVIATIEWKPNNHEDQQHLRLLGVNSPELHDKDPQVKAKAQEAKAYTTQHLLNKEVMIFTQKQDDFGRHLAIIHVEGSEFTFNDGLIMTGHAVPFKK